MSKAETLLKIKENGIVAVIRGKDKEEALRFSKACIDGGVKILEITFTVPDAIGVLKSLHDKLDTDAVLGAGTVLDATTARFAIMNGARFVVSPAFDKEVAMLCNLYQVPYMPGCMTPTEIVEALKYGADVIKIFPGSAFGPSYFSAIHGPLPQANLMPTGGVSVDNVGEWIKNGAFAVGAGSALVKGSSEEIIERAKAFIKNIKEARNNG
ncbi:bifunctional 4-hydroxy-2-oxoglutarate aldolase/2-dehydro-3-deoxy-phosphogluconate aldolase [Treponema phagedenis]|uniref:2-dehydro-3-deoxyphosphogluconate aldolase/4-hydroxy-2-oxoglutarate aldolase n=1 Tax=Treponema phagedenis TaxID=162 RepID=A0A0B7GWT3_TREPH|nr:bifunctional 2-keto-4-hydroxyglutarate aldolase/2-keto-3-deoxy-6-phosphogluconate aldolase [Treponema phagedenis]EFW38568.1 2-dehydro-3-deoxyphosphogluconate aldolase/4-hydroxy-2-oxoglutarate aldolase [Treponema phagedenis F0421]QEJ93925.1 bifunctional 4-hydroxy-2-oxoglutarate aldolase/2-dehydro-3-deoxy-phosphogluconate aldolase [Treponema phagedenis]QEK02066.1 bifunctional 4-hydroxy-2-oxoglutarate aldolase/2-dehydro-3-deoxy-phosphogluconate aldolase [Treponema phagedenis]QSI00319.1 bifuncti